jgi:AhpD family alkylhydroperoxidase
MEKKMSKIEEWKKERERLNEIIHKNDHIGIKRFFRLDGAAYEEGALDSRTKEMLGLVASLVLRCDDCVLYHIIQCAGLGITTEEFLDIINVGLIVGGSITIPHIRRAIDAWDKMQAELNSK